MNAKLKILIELIIMLLRNATKMLVDIKSGNINPDDIDLPELQAKIRGLSKLPVRKKK